MLHWLAGAKAPEGQADQDATGYAEPPETPAPVFAVRAFKQAIFGTPQTVQQPKPRRHSNNDNARPRPSVSRTERPRMNRPKSAGDVKFGADDDQVVPEPVSSPTKGILMTPGTAAARRKTVTFGDHVADNDEKRPIKSGLPEDCPGKFPSPWAKAGASEEERDAPAEKTRGRSKLTEALEEVRDESTKRESKKNKRHRNMEEDEHPTEFLDPKHEAGKYWKAMYDQYRENSQREMRKLITKQKAAKSFARDRDIQCTELADDLRQERKKSERLQKRTAELEAQLKSLQGQQPFAERVGGAVQTVSAKPVLSVQRSFRGAVKESALADRARSQGESAALTASRPDAVTFDPIRALPEGIAQAEPVATGATEPVKSSRTRSRPTNVRTATEDDIWNQALDSSSHAPVRAIDNPPVSPKAGRAVTSGTDLTPLKSLSINTLPTTNLTRRDSAQPSPPVNMSRFTKEPLVRQEVAKSPQPDQKREDSPILSPGLPQPTPETMREPRQTHKTQLLAAAPLIETEDDLSMPIPASSPFQPSPFLSPPGIDAKKSSYFDRKAQALSTSKTAVSPPAKENVSPPPKAKPLQTENVKPTAAWNAINAPTVAKRVTSITDKNGREVGLDRIEAAKARMAARGRVLS